MACVTACPSGVQYDRLIEQTRVEVERAPPRAPSRAAAARRALRRAARTAGACAPRWRCAGCRRPGPLARAQARSRRRGPRRHGRPSTCRAPGRASRSLAGCVQSVVFGDVNRRHRARARGRGLRRARAARAGVLRRAARPRRAPRRRASRAAGALERALGRARPHRHQRRRLRLAPQGPRRRRRRSTSRELLAGAGRGDAPPAGDHGRLPGLLPPAPRAGDRRGAAGDARRDPGPAARSSRRSPTSAAAAPGSTTSSSPQAAARARRAQGARACSRPARRPTRAPTPAAWSRSAPRCAGSAGRCRPSIPIELLDASIRGVDARPTTQGGAQMSDDDVLTGEAVEFLHLLAREFEGEREELLAARAARARAAARRRAAGLPGGDARRCARATGGCRRRRPTSPTAASRSPGRPIARW